MADVLNEAWIDFSQKLQVWRSACSTYDLARVVGAANAPIVRAIAERSKSDSPQEISPSEIAAMQDLKNATTGMNRAMDVMIASRETCVVASRKYEQLELAWATTALSRFQARWKHARVAAEVSRG